MIDLIAFSKEVHQNAVAHGWWETVPSFDQVINLCHEELSEALREYREGRPMEWYACGIENTACVGACGFCTNSSCPYKHDKPEGIAVEMVDCLLRILDYMAAVDYTKPIEVKAFAFADIHNLMECIAELHMDLSFSMMDEKVMHTTPCVPLSFAAGKIASWLKANYGENWEVLMLKKHEYNKRRPYRHGGKTA